MEDKPCVAVAMSGGVDSAVTAALLLERGYRVQGLTMRLWKEPLVTGEEEPDPAADARVVCEQLGILHSVVDLRELFLREVVDYFVREYAQGRTPNPCLRCNRLLKFGWLLEHARKLGCTMLATGHYARVERIDGHYQLLTARDARKDQSYFLYTLTQAELGAVLFLLGSLTKPEVRALAKGWGLSVAERPESQDICFLRHNDYRPFLAARLGEALHPGPIYDAQGHLLGEHRGLPFYTIGQREGLGIAAMHALYVLRLDPAHNALVVGTASELGHNALLAEEMTYVSGQAPEVGTLVEGKIRYRARKAAGRVFPQPGRRAEITFESPLRDITPGQAVVLYQGEAVLGGGIIAHAL